MGVSEFFDVNTAIAELIRNKCTFWNIIKLQMGNEFTFLELIRK